MTSFFILPRLSVSDKFHFLLLSSTFFLYSKLTFRFCFIFYHRKSQMSWFWYRFYDANFKTPAHSRFSLTILRYTCLWSPRRITKKQMNFYLIWSAVFDICPRKSSEHWIVQFDTRAGGFKVDQYSFSLSSTHHALLKYRKEKLKTGKWRKFRL